MRTKMSRSLAIAGSLSVLLALAACSTGTTTDGAGDSVAVDVGNDLTVNLSTGPLKVAVFIPTFATEYGALQEQVARDTAKDLGMEVTTFDAGFDPSEQLAQMQTVLQSGDYDAAVVQAADPTVICKIITEDYPKANILVSANVTSLCDYGVTQTGASPDEVWAPGTLNFVGSNNTLAYINGWFAAAAKANPGDQHVAVLLGPATAAHSRVVQVALEKFQSEHPGYTVDVMNTDYSSTDSYNQTQTYLQGHPDTTLILSVYSPDISQGAIKAIDDAGLTGKIAVIDQGFGEYLFTNIEDGVVQFSTLFFPANSMKLSLESIANAQKGDPGPRFVDDSVVGSASEPFTVNAETITDLPAGLR